MNCSDDEKTTFAYFIMEIMSAQWPVMSITPNPHLTPSVALIEFILLQYKYNSEFVSGPLCRSKLFGRLSTPLNCTSSCVCQLYKNLCSTSVQSGRSGLYRANSTGVEALLHQYLWTKTIGNFCRHTGWYRDRKLESQVCLSFKRNYSCRIDSKYGSTKIRARTWMGDVRGGSC